MSTYSPVFRFRPFSTVDKEAIDRDIQEEAASATLAERSGKYHPKGFAGVGRLATAAALRILHPFSDRDSLVARSYETPEASLRRRGRAVTIIASAAALVSLLDVACSPETNSSERRCQTYEVKEGDTIWDIADEATQGDPRKLADKLSHSAGLQGYAVDRIQPGQKLRACD